jgi:hypothetical protein
MAWKELHLMKRFLWIAIAITLLLPAGVQAQTVDEIIEKNIGARGGRVGFSPLRACE